MFVYFFVFIISIFFFNLALSSKLKIGKFIFLIITILIPSLFAGLRNEDIGSDMLGYGSNFFYRAVQCDSFSEYIQYNTGEIGYFMLNYVCSRISSDIHFFLFFHQCIVISLVILTACKCKDKLSSLFILTFYFLFLYNPSLTMMRQIISVAFILYGTSCLINRKPIVFFIFIGLAQLFHNSSIIALFIYLLIYAVKKYNSKMLVIYFFISILVLFVFLFFKTSLGSLILMLSDKYSNYLVQQGFKTHKVELLIYSILFIVTFFLRKKNVLQINIVRSFLFLSIGIILMGELFETASRLVYNIIAPVWILYPTIAVNKNVQKKYVFIFLLLFIISYSYKASNGYSLTVPYKSNILDIK